MSRDVVTIEVQHPVTKKRVKCKVFLSYYGPGIDGYRFSDIKAMYTKEELEALN